MEQKLLNALLAHYKSVVATAEAELTIYLAKPVGIGEHSDIMEEVIKKWDTLADAQDKLERLITYIKSNNIE